MKILLVEDEPSLLRAMRQYLEEEGYVVTTAATFANASTALNDYDYDCIVVDIGLPDGNGLNLIRQLKAAQKPSGLIIISAKDSLDDKLTGLELGSDDYITKPFHLPELNARIKSVLRRRFFGGNTLIRYGEIVVDPLAHQVMVQGKPLEMTEKEYHLLLFFMANPNRLLTKAAIAEYVWGDHMDMADSHDFLYTHIKNLRRKLMDAGCPDYIKTRYGAGYLFSQS
ncbi:two component transcriptional regulator, winged helix family (plasmid) [Fibrella aestuarina BUZ 2]|uniref:Two component transcriptional regulator, winged helix family n=1 Tax=Fibrella aestuarina BUZ 2 TaxID=1166018 RepID=I0KHN5_9BACT|nr:response regulator transcription factor [Fibrella aestuarina]CCH03638.1 two component transcriptional regulator, winged helix family [Fibrella aestuarina BUZ 2]